MTAEKDNSNRIFLFLDSLRKRGILNTFLVSLSYLFDYLFDIIHGTETHTFVELDALGVDKSHREHAHMYQPTFGAPLRRLLKELRIPSEKVFVDLGCGKGKVLLVASEFGFKEARGVEISPSLCEVARRNCAIYRSKKKTGTVFSILNSDALDYEIRDDEDIFFLFNPFDAYVLEQVVQNISASLQKHRRKIWIIYRNAVHRDVIEKTIDHATVTDHTYWGLDFVVFEIE